MEEMVVRNVPLKQVDNPRLSFISLSLDQKGDINEKTFWVVGQLAFILFEHNVLQLENSLKRELMKVLLK